MAAKGIQFPRRWYGGMISANLEVIWVMSVEAGQTGDARRIATPGRGNSVMKVLLISTYDLGHQPFGLASPTAWLREAGADVHCLDLAVEEFDEDAVAGAALVAIYLPMHTATRLAVSVIERVQKLNRDASLCCFGLYAPVNAALLRKLGVHSVIGGEFEQPLADLYRRVVDGRVGEFQTPLISFGKQQFRLPDRSSLPPWIDTHNSYGLTFTAGRWAIPKRAAAANIGADIARSYPCTTGVFVSFSGTSSWLTFANSSPKARTTSLLEIPISSTVLDTRSRW